MARLALVTRKDWELSEIQAICGGKKFPFRRNGQLERIGLVLTIALLFKKIEVRKVHA